MTGVTHADIANWQYMEVIRTAAEPKCSSHLENSISTIDSMLAARPLRYPLKRLFGLAGLEHDEDFVSLLQVCHTLGCRCFHVDVSSQFVGTTRRVAEQELEP